MAAIADVTLNAIHLGSKKVRFEVDYTARFADWEVEHRMDYSQRVYIYEQEIGRATMKEFFNANAGPTAVGFQTINDDMDDRRQHIEMLPTLTATASEMRRSVTIEEVEVWRDDTQPNELYAVVALIPHYRAAHRWSAPVPVHTHYVS